MITMFKKRFLSGLSATAFLAAAFLTLSNTASAFGEANLQDDVSCGDTGVTRKGDVSCDGAIDALDSSLILTDYALRSAGKDSIFSMSQSAAADVNADGSIDALDASMVLGYYAYISAVSPIDPESYFKNPPTNPGTMPPVTDEPTTSEPEHTNPKHDIQVINGVTYIDGIVIANKSYSLPADYNPGLDTNAEAWFNVLKNDAAACGLNIWLASGFRSYSLQSQIYNKNCYMYGQEITDTFSARPGFSEHQSGLAIDVNTISDDFAYTPEAAWLAENCWKYGFIIRYPLGKEHITGYKYEPWHIRFVGYDMAKKIYSSGLTLEEYFGIDSQYQ